MWRPDSLAGGCGAPAAGGEQRSPGAHGFDRHSANAQTAVGDAASAGIRRHWHGDAAVDCPGKNWPGTIGSPLTNTSVVDTSAVAQGADRSRARRRRRVEMAMAAGGSCHCDCIQVAGWLIPPDPGWLVQRGPAAEARRRRRRRAKHT